jgi:hypothetical protein
MNRATPAEDKQFARMSRWLVANEFKLRSLNTARSNKQAVILILERKPE